MNRGWGAKALHSFTKEDLEDDNGFLVQIPRPSQESKELPSMESGGDSPYDFRCFHRRNSSHRLRDPIRREENETESGEAIAGNHPA